MFLTEHRKVAEKYNQAVEAFEAFRICAQKMTHEAQKNADDWSVHFFESILDVPSGESPSLKLIPPEEIPTGKCVKILRCEDHANWLEERLQQLAKFFSNYPAHYDQDQNTLSNNARSQLITSTDKKNFDDWPTTTDLPITQIYKWSIIDFANYALEQVRGIEKHFVENLIKMQSPETQIHETALDAAIAESATDGMPYLGGQLGGKNRLISEARDALRWLQKISVFVEEASILISTNVVEGTTFSLNLLAKTVRERLR